MDITIYTYTGFGKPKRLVNSLFELITDIRVYDNYLGDKTDEMVEEIAPYATKESLTLVDIQEMNDILACYNIIINPTLDDLIERASAWFSKASIPVDHFTDFGTQQEIKDRIQNG